MPYNLPPIDFVSDPVYFNAEADDDATVKAVPGQKKRSSLQYICRLLRFPVESHASLTGAIAQASRRESGAMISIWMLKVK